MKTNLKHWLGRVPDLSAVLARFPVAAGLMALFTIFIIFDGEFRVFDWFEYLLSGFVIAAYLCVSFTIWRENSDTSRGISVQLGMIAIVLILAYFAKNLHLNVAMGLGASILILGNAKRFLKPRDDLHVWDFTHKIWTGAAFATLGSIIFTIGIFAISFALKSLFGLRIDDLLEEFILPVGLGFLAPLYWLSTIPKVDEPIEDLTNDPGFVSKAVAFLGTWIMSPLTLIYALILLAYGIKIIVQGELPKGEIAALTTPFLIIGTITWLLLFPPFIREKFLANIYRKSWFFLSLPAAILLAISVGVRVNEYGLTQDRFALILCVIWALGVGVLFSFGSVAKRDIRIIPGLAAMLFALGTFLSLNLSLSSQYKRAKSGLKLAGIMTDAGVIKPRDEISIDDEDGARQAKGAIQYLIKNDAQNAVKNLFKHTQDETNGNEFLHGEIYERLGLENVQVYRRHMGRNENFTTLRYLAPRNEFSISGFETLYGEVHIRMGGRHEGDMTYLNNSYIWLHQKDNRLKLELKGRNVNVGFDLMEWAKGLPRNENFLEVEPPYLVLHETHNEKVALLLTSVNRYDENTDSIRTLEVNAFLVTSGLGPTTED